MLRRSAIFLSIFLDLRLSRDGHQWIAIVKGGEAMDLKSISRRGFLTRASTLGAASLIGVPQIALAEPPPETTTFRIAQGPFICYAPQMLAEAMLRQEGFTNVEYIPIPAYHTHATFVADGGVDLAVFGPTSAIRALDEGWPLTMVAGVHVGCWELFANENIRNVGGLAGKRVAILKDSAVDHLWIAAMLAYVGVHPRKQVHWVSTGKLSESMRLFLRGEVDAFLAFPPQPQDMRRLNAGHVLVNTTFDSPWSQYFCCMAAMKKEFVQRNPIASKRAIRALLKAVDICSYQPEVTARLLVKKGFAPSYETGLEIIKEIPYGRWRTDNPEDTLRFHGLRLYEVGMLKHHPSELIEAGTDFSILNELKREMKA